VAEVNPALIIRIVGGHIVRADLIVDTLTGPANRRDDIIARLKVRDVWTDSFHTPKALVTEDQEVISWRRGAVFRSIDLLVGTINANPQDFDENSAAIGHILQ
jgi:predicted amidohydrolase